MCSKESCCQKKDDKVKDPCECSPEQIKECHGDEKEHSCCCGKKKS